MKLTIITGTFNSAHGINKYMDSILHQDYENIEYIIIDGESKDLTLEIISEKQKTHPSIKLISESDQGIYDALNKGLSAASGDIIGFVHSDDFLESNR